MPCCAMMQPMRKVISRTIGTARQPTLSTWCTIEVKRNRVRPHDDAQQRHHYGAEHVDDVGKACQTKTTLSPIEAMA